MPPLSQFQVPKSRQLAAKETGLFRQLLVSTNLSFCKTIILYKLIK